MMASRPAFGSALAAVTLALLIVASSAFGQWVWKDEAGHVVASDQPPPTSVPQSRILKEPRGRTAVPPPPVDKDANATAAKADAPKSLADRELESRQRQKEQAEASKKSDDEAAKAKALQDNCASVRSNLAALKAGGRAARFNEKGERVYIDDDQRQGEIAKSQGQVAQYCK